MLLLLIVDNGDSVKNVASAVPVNWEDRNHLRSFVSNLKNYGLTSSPS